MQLVINTYGAFIQKNGDCFRVKVEDKVMDISANKISSIIISTAATITTDVIKHALEHNIDIVFLDDFGDPYGRVWHPKLGSTTLIRRKQLEISDKEEGLKLALSWINNKFQNQIDLLKKLRETRPQRSAEITRYMEKLKSIQAKLNTLCGTIDNCRNYLLSIEGEGGRVYFECISALMPEKYKFEGRSRNPAKDQFNALLNYAYGILYSKVEKACIVAGLDPYVGIIHTDHYNKQSFVFDLIENYRIWADTVVINMIAGRKVKDEFFEPSGVGIKLNKDGKAALISELNSFLDEKIRYKGRNVKREYVIQLDCHAIANSLIGAKDEF